MFVTDHETGKAKKLCAWSSTVIEGMEMVKLFVICISIAYMVFPVMSSAGVFSDNGNGTVTDSMTNLTWQQGESISMPWEGALTYCEGLVLAAQMDWRLPNIKELSTIVDDTRTSPAIITIMFPGAHSSTYWSSTSYDSENAWAVDFTRGSSRGFNYGKMSTNFVRCVRGGQ